MKIYLPHQAVTLRFNCFSSSRSTEKRQSTYALIRSKHNPNIQYNLVATLRSHEHSNLAPQNSPLQPEETVYLDAVAR
jgi:hypothetical protein